MAVAFGQEHLDLAALPPALLRHMPELDLQALRERLAVAARGIHHVEGAIKARPQQKATLARNWDLERQPLLEIEQRRHRPLVVLAQPIKNNVRVTISPAW